MGGGGFGGGGAGADFSISLVMCLAISLRWSSSGGQQRAQRVDSLNMELSLEDAVLVSLKKLKFLP